MCFSVLKHPKRVASKESFRCSCDALFSWSRYAWLTSIVLNLNMLRASVCFRPLVTYFEGWSLGHYHNGPLSVLMLTVMFVMCVHGANPAGTCPYLSDDGTHGSYIKRGMGSIHYETIHYDNGTKRCIAVKYHMHDLKLFCTVPS